MCEFQYFHPSKKGQHENMLFVDVRHIHPSPASWERGALGRPTTSTIRATGARLSCKCVLFLILVRKKCHGASGTFSMVAMGRTAPENSQTTLTDGKRLSVLLIRDRDRAKFAPWTAKAVGGPPRMNTDCVRPLLTVHLMRTDSSASESFSLEFWCHNRSWTL